MAVKVLVVDDEEDVCQMLTDLFQRDGWTVVTCKDSHRAVGLAFDESPDIIILDVIMSGLDGISICRAIRERSSVPIIFLSARGQAIDRIIGLRAGADDYLVKPFDLDELEARVNALLRRTHGAPGNGAERVLQFGNLSFDTARRTLSYKGEQVTLSPMESSLLEKLGRSPRRMLSREELSRDVWHHDGNHASRTIDVHVQRLRRKLDQVGKLGNWIVTIKSGGYEFAPTDETE